MYVSTIEKELPANLSIHDIDNLVSSSYVELHRTFKFFGSLALKYPSLYSCFRRTPYILEFSDVETGECFSFFLKHQIPLCYA